MIQLLRTVSIAGLLVGWFAVGPSSYGSPDLTKIDAIERFLREHPEVDAFPCPWHLRAADDLHSKLREVLPVGSSRRQDFLVHLGGQYPYLVGEFSDHGSPDNFAQTIMETLSKIKVLAEKDDQSQFKLVSALREYARMAPPVKPEFKAITLKQTDRLEALLRMPAASRFPVWVGDPVIVELAGILEELTPSDPEVRKANLLTLYSEDEISTVDFNHDETSFVFGVLEQLSRQGMVVTEDDNGKFRLIKAFGG